MVTRINVFKYGSTASVSIKCLDDDGIVITLHGSWFFMCDLHSIDGYLTTIE